MRKILLFFFLFTFWEQGFTQNSEIEQLAKRITIGIQNDSLKVVAISKWLIDNISYDIKNYELSRKGFEMDNNINKIDYILEYKKTVCSGYSNFFNTLCALNNIQSKSISGYAMGLCCEKREDVPVDESNHSWNAVKINEKWYLMDITWADNDSEDGSFDAEYMWSDPSVFILKHLPEDPFWQFLDAPISLNCFKFKQNCNDNIELKPNFGQHITEELKLDSLEILYNYYKRAIGFNPNNIELKIQAAYFFLERADDALNSYFILKNQQMKTFDVFKDIDSIILPLKLAKNYYEASNSLYIKITNAKANFKTVNIKHNNSKILEIEREIELVKLFFSKK